MNSFKGYGKVDTVDRQQARLQSKRKARRRVIIISVASVVLIAIIICVAVGIIRSKRNNGGDSSDQGFRTSNKVIQVVCNQTRYPDVCVSSLSSYPGSSQAGPKDLVRIAVLVAMNEVNTAFAHVSDLINRTKNAPQRIALQDCAELLNNTVDELGKTVSNLKVFDLKSLTAEAGDVQTWLSASLTNQDTCLDGLAEKFNTTKVIAPLQNTVHNVTKLISNSLAIVSSISGLLSELKFPFINRRLLSDSNAEPDVRNEFETRDGFPSWLSAADRRLLQASLVTTKPNLIVAADGTGNYRTIQEAVNAAPVNSSKRFIIHVRKGNYSENVVIGTKKKNLLFIGDGIDSTIVTGRQNVVDGNTTFHSATFAAMGDGFIAQDMTFENTAGPVKHQAVALRVGADQSVIYRCKITGYQDTLYVHSHRQFYKDCTISGTVDFIFGNAAVVFQNCNLLARKGLDVQQNTITAQGRTDPKQNTGISIQSCTISADSDLFPVKNMTLTYLGRPWKNFSRTVIMETNMDDVINPAGWLAWLGDFALDTLYYAEYRNTGVGAITTHRVKWPGFRVLTSPTEANKFTVGEFIEDVPWLEYTGVGYSSGL